MRTIKFRAWDERNKKMILFDFKDIYEDGNTYRYSGWPLENMPKMQFTGLLDKNGKEIFEGDIVSRFHDTQRSAVEFKRGCFVSHIQLSGGAPIAEEILCNDLSVTEVIGNIYENQELLKIKED